MPPQPLLTIFAGPNGSGKSSLKKQHGSAQDLGVYINADEIATEMFQAALVRGESVVRETFEVPAFNEAERRRQECVAAGVTFSFETVFSHESKLDLITKAKAAGYFVRLYFVSTEDATLNVERVRKRVLAGGHPVPHDKIISRYHRAMKNLAPACRLVDDANLYDNTAQLRLAAQHIRAGHLITIIEPSPNWIRLWHAEMQRHDQGGDTAL
jgi:predicted ABC-type ATPase